MPSAFEDNLATLISRIDDLAASLANAPTAREQLTSLKTGVQSLCSQAITEYRRTEFADGSRRRGTDSDCGGERRAFAFRVNAASRAISARLFRPG
jgi:hypothetical protein